MRIYPVKENLIGSAVIEILRYKQTDRQTDRQKHILLLYNKDSNRRWTMDKNLIFQLYT